MPTGNARNIIARALDRRAASPTKRSPPVTPITPFRFPNVRFSRSTKSSREAHIVLYFSPPTFIQAKRLRPSNVRRKVSDLAGLSGRNRYGQFSMAVSSPRADYDGHRGRQKTLRPGIGWGKGYLLLLEVRKRADGLVAHPVACILRWSCCAWPVTLSCSSSHSIGATGSAPRVARSHASGFALSQTLPCQRVGSYSGYRVEPSMRPRDAPSVRNGR